MKLLNAAGYVYPKCDEVGGYKPGFFGRLFGLPIVKSELIFKERQEPWITQCTIDFETTPCSIDVVHHQSVAFGDQLYIGIKPIRHEHSNVWTCVVERLEAIRIEPKIQDRSYYY